MLLKEFNEELARSDFDFTNLNTTNSPIKNVASSNHSKRLVSYSWLFFIINFEKFAFFFRFLCYCYLLEFFFALKEIQYII